MYLPLKVAIAGLMSKKEKVLPDRILQIREGIEEELRLSLEELETVEDPETRAMLLDDSARCQRFLKVIDNKIGR